MKKVILAVMSIGLGIALVGCGSAAETPKEGPAASQEQPAQEEQKQPLDLTGEWKQTNSNTEDKWMEATVSDGSITVNWVSPDSKSLYWAGTYVAPTEAADSYSWESVNDKEQTGKAMLASGDDTKKFTYEGGELAYEQTALGTTMTVRMALQ